MARISYDDQTAAAYKAVREVPRDGLGAWREAVRRHLRPSPGMTVVDIGAGTGAFAAAFSDWFALAILAVEPSAAMRAQIPRRPDIKVLDGHASALPLPDGSADAATLEDSLYNRHFLIARPIVQALENSPSVLLIDEIDRADDEFEAFLLEVLADNAVSIPELGTIRALAPPLVVITSNRTREVHDALKRRCLYHWIAHPDKALHVLGADHLDAERAKTTLGAAVKYHEDQVRVQRTILPELMERLG